MPLPVPEVPETRVIQVWLALAVQDVLEAVTVILRPLDAAGVRDTLAGEIVSVATVPVPVGAGPTPEGGVAVRVSTILSISGFSILRLRIESVWVPAVRLIVTGPAWLCPVNHSGVQLQPIFLR